MEKIIIGVTGSIGTGKTTVCKLIKEAGYEVIDCDEVSHQVLINEPGYTNVVSAFGEEVVDDDGTINRKKLGKIVFNDIKERELLEKIVHPIIYRDLEFLIRKSESKIIFIECPLLFETNFIDLCTYSIVVYSDINCQIDRLMKRDGFDFKTALARIYAQMSLEEKMNKADFIIDNCHEEKDLSWQVKQLLARIERKM